MVIILNSISVNDLRSLGSVNIIDIRSEEKYNDNHILNAYNIPFNKLVAVPERYLDKNNTYYIYCQKGEESRKVCRLLSNLGYKVINIKGGYESWILNN